MWLAPKNILFQLTGSIACYKACEVISALVQLGHQVQCVASQSALQFVGKATLEGLTQNPVLTDVFAEGDLMGHIHWARWADVIVLCPASANTINKLTAGVADDFIGNLFLAKDHSTPYLIFPAMNSQMLIHPSVVRSMTQLKNWGNQVMDTDQGVLACKEQGYGRLLEPKTIVDYIQSSFDGPLSEPKGQILITAGGTRENIDGVRFISNFSTGRTGATLADYFVQQGDQVCFLHGIGAEKPTYKTHNIEFSSFKDLDEKIKIQLSETNYHTIIHLAAVSDFSIDSIEQAQFKSSPLPNIKLSSDQDLKINLKRNHKIVCRLKEQSKNKDIRVIAFKLTQNATSQQKLQAVKHLFESAQIDLIVHNDLGCMNQSGRHQFNIYSSECMLIQINNTVSLAQYLNDYLQKPKKIYEREPEVQL